MSLNTMPLFVSNITIRLYNQAKILLKNGLINVLNVPLKMKKNKINTDIIEYFVCPPMVPAIDEMNIKNNNMA